MTDSTEVALAQDAAQNPEARRVALKVTGEVFDLTGPDETVAEVLVTLDGYLRDLQDARAEVQAEIVSRMDRSATWTMNAGGVKLSAPSPAAGEKLDGEALAESMKTLVEDGVIEMPAYDKAFAREVKLTMPDAAWISLKAWVAANEERGVKGTASWKVEKGGLNAIVKVAGDRGRALIAAATLPGDTARRVSVKAKP